MNEELARIAQTAVCAQRPGPVVFRQIADNMFEAEGGLIEFSQLLESLLALCLEFTQAFASCMDLHGTEISESVRLSTTELKDFTQT